MKKRNQKTSRRKKADDSLFSYYSFSEEDAKKYPVVSKILKQLTPERIKKEIEAIRKVEVPPELQRWVEKYEKVGGKRDDFFWKWIYVAIQETTFPMIEKKFYGLKKRNEFLLIMFIILIDDITDFYKENKENKMDLFKELLKIPSSEYFKNERLSKKKVRLFDFVVNIWYEIERNVKLYPRYKKLSDIFKYDIVQIINAIKYNYLINKNHFLINKTEYWLYSFHTMQIVTAATMDLMCISKFDLNELGLIREAAIEAQKMARIGNCLSTWKREINDSDFTSSIFAYSIEKKIIFYNELKKEKSLKLIKKIKEAKIEKDLLIDWDTCYTKLFEHCKRIKSIKIDKFLFGEEKLFVMYLISKEII